MALFYNQGQDPRAKKNPFYTFWHHSKCVQKSSIYISVKKQSFLKL